MRAFPEKERLYFYILIQEQRGFCRIHHPNRLFIVVVCDVHIRKTQKMGKNFASISCDSNSLQFVSEHMLEEIRTDARDISLGEETDAIRQMIPYHILEYHRGYKKGNRVLSGELRDEIADYMLRFCDAVQSVMDNAPEYDLIDFQRP